MNRSQFFEPKPFAQNLNCKPPKEKEGAINTKVLSKFSNNSFLQHIDSRRSQETRKDKYSTQPFIDAFAKVKNNLIFVPNGQQQKKLNLLK